MKNEKSDQSSNPDDEQREPYQSIIVKIIMQNMENKIKRHEALDKSIETRNKKYGFVVAVTVLAYITAIIFHICGDPVQALEGYLYVLTLTIVLFLGILASEIVLFLKNIRKR